MDRVCKDELILMCMKLDVRDIISLSSINKSIKRKIENLWKYKLQDFPDYLNCDFENKTEKEIYRLVTLKEKLKLEENIYDIYNMKTLDLRRSMIIDIPKDLGILINLENLDLSNNRIREIPKELGNLINLEYLNLAGNKIREIPKELGNLFRLGILYLNLNNIKSLPKELGNLRSLRMLYAYNNIFINIHDEIRNIPGLTLYI